MFKQVRAGRLGPAMRWSKAALLALLVVLTAACSSESFTMEGTGPYSYPAPVKSSLERVAIEVKLRNLSSDDLPVNPVDFVARDAQHRIYPSNPAATAADADIVRNSTALRGVLPLPVTTLRQGEIVDGFVVFDVPTGVRPVEVILRQADSDRVVGLSAAR
jgi:hypothetical protein